MSEEGQKTEVLENILAVFELLGLLEHKSMLEEKITLQLIINPLDIFGHGLDFGRKFIGELFEFPLLASGGNNDQGCGAVIVNDLIEFLHHGVVLRHQVLEVHLQLEICGKAGGYGGDHQGCSEHQEGPSFSQLGYCCK